MISATATCRGVYAPPCRETMRHLRRMTESKKALRKSRASVSAGPGGTALWLGNSYDLLEVSLCACFIALLDSLFTCDEVSVGLMV